MKKDRIQSFNPRICKRCDLGYVLIPSFKAVSIHASVKDATTTVLLASAEYIVSIHASVKDATGAETFNINPNIVSIHASVKDATNTF